MLPDRDEENRAYFEEATEALFTIAKILGELAKNQKELYAVQALDPHLANLAVLAVRRKLDDPRPRVKKVIRDENGKITGLESLEYEQ